MKNSQKTDSEALASRYGAGFSQYVTDQIECLDRRDIDFLDIKELNDLVGAYRTRIKDLIALYRTAQNINNAPGPLMRRVYANHETIFIHRQIKDLRELYRMARADSRELTNEYIHRLKTHSLDQMAYITEKTKAA